MQQSAAHNFAELNIVRSEGALLWNNAVLACKPDAIDLFQSETIVEPAECLLLSGAAFRTVLFQRFLRNDAEQT